jgi:hypothetical protein
MKRYYAIAASFLILFVMCDNSGGGSSKETTNPNVTIQMERGDTLLFATKDYIYFPDCTADGVAGNATPPLSFAITNTGTETMKIYRIVSVGTGKNDFVIDSSATDDTVAPAGSTGFTVSFNPLTWGHKTASIRVVTNAGNVKSYELAVRGNALPVPVNAANTATHNFQEKITGDLTVAPRGVIHGYINPDGGLRILAGCKQTTGITAGARLSVFEHDSAGSTWDFISEDEILFSTTDNDMLEPVICHDFDGDGVEELLCRINYAATFVKWNGSAYVICWEDQADLITCSYGAILADIDRDGREELITGTDTQTRIYSWDDGFSNVVCDDTLAGGGEFGVGVGDIDGDGFLEIATTDEGAPDIYVYRFDGDSYQQIFNGTSFSSDIGYNGFSAVDIDGDYKAELIGGSPNYATTSRSLSLFEWSGTALTETPLIQSAGLSAIYQCATGDFDRDGQAEAMVDLNGGYNVIIEMTGSGIEANDSSIDYYMFLEPFDLDGDGFPEILVNEYTTSNAALLVKDEVSNP